MSFESVIDFFICLCFFIACTDFFHIIGDTLVESFEVSDDELRIDDLDISLRVDRSTHMVDIGVVESSHYLEDSIDISDMRKEFVPKSFSLTRSLDESCDIYEFDTCWYGLCTIYHGTDLLETFVVHIYDSDVGFYGTKWKIRSFCSVGFGQGIKKRRFTDVRESDDTDLHRERRV